MRTFFLTLAIAFTFLQSCKEQAKSKPRVIVNKDFHWTIEIPDGFEPVPEEQWTKMQNRGADLIEKTYDTKLEISTTILFVYRSGKLNHFEANYQPLDTATDGAHVEVFSDGADLLYGTFEAQMPDATLDSTISQETIDGKVFQKFHVTIEVADKVVMEYLMYSRLFGNKDLTINIMTTDKRKQEALLKAWRNSKFGHL